MADMNKDQTSNESTITCYVDDQPIEVDQQEVTVRRLLELAGGSADSEGDQALLRELRGDEQIEHRDPNETIKIEGDMRFYTSDSAADNATGPTSSSSDVKTDAANATKGVETKTGGGGSAGGGGKFPSNAGSQPSGGAGGNLQNRQNEQSNPAKSGSTANASGAQRTGEMSRAQSGYAGGKEGVTGTPNPSKGSNPSSGPSTPGSSNKSDFNAQAGSKQGMGARQVPNATGGSTSTTGSSTSGSPDIGSEAGKYNEGEKREAGSRRSGQRPEHGAEKKEKTEESET